MKKIGITCILIISLLVSCHLNNIDVTINDINVPVTENSMQQPFLFANGDDLLLSWTEKSTDSLVSIKYAEFVEDKWSQSIKVAEDDNFFVNWADFPAIAKNNDNILMHYLQKSSPSSYAYDVRLLVSSTNGNTFNTDFLLHNDDTKTEHGFVSMIPYKDDFFVTWLDGRNMEEGGHGAEHHSNGNMNLRAAIVLSTGNVIDDAILDVKTCECCQTSAAITKNGPIVIYRDRSDDEIRDIAITRWVDSVWTTPKIIYNDNWSIKGCPVNGPKAAALNATLAITWFTAADNIPKVNIIFSDTNGEAFGEPIQIDSGKPIGRVDVALIDEENAFVSWMESTTNDAQIKVIKVNKNGTKSKPIVVADISAARSSGFPQLELVNDILFVAYNHLEGDKISIKMKSVDATIFN